MCVLKENSISMEEIKKIQDTLQQNPLKEELELLKNQLQSQLDALDLKLKAVENLKVGSGSNKKWNTVYQAIVVT